MNLTDEKNMGQALERQAKLWRAVYRQLDAKPKPSTHQRFSDAYTGASAQDRVARIKAAHATKV